MGVENGGGGTRPPQSKNQRGRPPRNYDISASFFLTHDNFAFSTIFKIKWPKSEEKLNFGGRWVWVPMNPSPPKQKFVATSLSICIRHCPSSLIGNLHRNQSCTNVLVIQVHVPLPDSHSCRHRLLKGNSPTDTH